MNQTQQMRAGPGPLAVPAGSLYSRLLPPELIGRPKDYFAYGVNFLPVTAGARQSATFAVENDSDFLLVSACIDVRTDVAPPVLVAGAAVLANVIATGSGRNFFNQDMPIDNIFGTAQLPSYWPYPKLLKAASTVETQLTNNQAVDLQIRITYHGFKVFAN